MKGLATDDERIRYLAGDGTPAVPIDDGERAELDAVRALLVDPSLWDEPSADLGDRVVAAIDAERGSSAVPLAPSPTLVPLAPQVRVRTGNVRDIRDARRSRVLTFLAGAAAAAVVAVAISVVPRGSSGGDRIALAGTELAPGSSGSARILKRESGLRIELNAAGLPRRDGRLFYQAWLKGAGGLVPVGTFHTGDHVVLWAGVALEDFPTITVTQEEVGDQASSGLLVLVGTLGG